MLRRSQQDGVEPALGAGPPRRLDDPRVLEFRQDDARAKDAGPGAQAPENVDG
jgi:hypothetical protein